MNLKENKIFIIALIFQVNFTWGQPPVPPSPVELSINSNFCELALIVLILGFLLYKKYSLQNKTT